LLGLNNNELVLVTNATKNGNLFSGYTNIVLAHEVFNNKPQPKTKNAKIPVQEEVVYEAPVVTTEQGNAFGNNPNIENNLEKIRKSENNSVSLQEELDNLNKERRSLIRMLSIESNEVKLQKVEDRIKEIKSELGLIENKPVTEAINILNNVSELTPKQKSKYIVEAYKMLNLTLKPEQLKNIDETFNSIKTQIESAGLTAEINKKCNL